MKIDFIAMNRHVMEVREKPRPAVDFLPDWYKSMPSVGEEKFNLSPAANVTAKKCFPLKDAITAGYIVTLWADIFVDNDGEYPLIKWATSEAVIDTWSPQQSAGYEIPSNCSLPVFKYLHGWIPKTPKGYSCTVTHPVGYPNLPFFTLSGVIDTDKLTTSANAPFVLKTGFSGIIKKGTPMFQITPFKREKWESTFSSRTIEDDYYENEKLKTSLVSSYGRFLRSKKEYL
jgi:hypothetical protein